MSAFFCRSVFFYKNDISFNCKVKFVKKVFSQYVKTLKLNTIYFVKLRQTFFSFWNINPGKLVKTYIFEQEIQQFNTCF